MPDAGHAGTFWLRRVRGGEELFLCSSLDKLIIVWSDGRYRVVNPPDKLFVDKSMIYCAIMDKDRQMTVVYTQKDYGFTYIKRFTFGGAIMNRDYLCTPEHSTILHLQEGSPENIYVKYKPSKGQRIHQQCFHPGDVIVKGVKAKGVQMTSKSIARIAVDRPRWWKDDAETPRGVML